MIIQNHNKNREGMWDMLTENNIGQTKMVKLHQLVSSQSASVFVKLEDNDFGSVKSRIAWQMICDAEQNGRLTPGSGQTIIEATGGNTGAGLAAIGVPRGYKVVLVIPDNFSPSKIEICKARGADVMLSDSSLGQDSHVKKTEELLQQHPEYINLNQFSNPSNPKSHYLNTGAEILGSIGKHVDAFVTVVGSGGTISGVGKRLKEASDYRTQVVAVQPQGCNVLAGTAVPHIVEGTTLGFIPKNFDTTIVDDVVEITADEIRETLKNLLRFEGLFVGFSSAANICGAIKVAEKLSHDCVVSTISPDGGRNYPSSIFND